MKTLGIIGALALVLAGCGTAHIAAPNPTSTTTQASTATTLPPTFVALQEWINTEETPRARALMTEVEAMQAAMSANNPGMTGTACHAMSVGTNQDLTSTAPVAAVETHWRAMLYDFQAVAAGCLQAVAHGADAQLAASLNTDLSDATTQIGQLDTALTIAASAK